MSNLTALGGTHGVVGHVDIDAKQLLSLGGLTGLGSRNHTSETVELLDSLDAVDIQSSSQVGLVAVNAAAIKVASQQHDVHQMGSAVESQIAGALVLLTQIQRLGDDGLGVNVVLAEVLTGVASLKLAASSIEVNITMDGVQLVVRQDRTDMSGEDLIGSIILTSIADHDSPGQLLVQLESVDSVLVGNIVEIGHVDDVVTIQSALDIHGLGVGGAPYLGILAGQGLLLTLVVAFCSQAVDVANVDLTGANAAEGRLVNAIQDGSHPALVVGNQFGHTGADILVLREQDIQAFLVKAGNLGDFAVIVAVGQMVVGIRFQSLTETAAFLGIGQNGLLIGMTDNSGVLPLIVVENIVFHLFFLLLGIGFFAVVFQGLSNEGVDNGLLFFVQSVKHVCNGLLLLGRIILLGLFCHLFLLLFLVIRVTQADFIAAVDNGFLLGVSPIAMLDDGLDIGAGICAGKHKTDFTNLSMQDVSAIMLKLVGVNGQSRNVTVLNSNLCGLSRLAIVELAVSDYSIGLVHKQCVAKDVIRGVMLVIPNKRDCFAITLFECVTPNSPAVGTLDVVSGCVTIEIKVHFEFLLPLVFFFRRWSRSLFFLGSAQISVPEFISLRVIGRLHTNNLANFVGRHDLVSSHLVCDFGKFGNRHQLERVPKENNRLPLGSSRLGQKFPLHLVSERRENWFDCSVVVVQHGLLVRGSVHYGLSDTQLAIEHARQVFNLTHEVVIDRAIELNYFFGTVGICDTILGAGKLVFKVFTPCLCLLLSGFGFYDIRKLNNEVEFSTSALFVDGIQNVQLSDKPLHGRIRFIDDRIQRILYDSYNALRKNDFFFPSIALVIKPNLDMLRIPLGNLTDSHGVNVVRTSFLRIETRVDWNQGDASFVKHREECVLKERSTSLVDICR